MKGRQVKAGYKSALDRKIEKMHAEQGYWKAVGHYETELGRAHVAFMHVRYDALEKMIASEPHVQITDIIWNPPAEDFDLEQDRISRLLDDEEFLSTGNFRNPAYGNIADFMGEIWNR